MEGIITVKDSREQLNEFKEWRKEAIQTVNREKVRYTALEACDIGRFIATGVGVVATVVTALSPAPYLAPIVAKASAALAASLTLGKYAISHNTEKDKINKISAKLTDLEGNTKDVSMPDNNIIQMEEQPAINYDETKQEDVGAVLK